MASRNIAVFFDGTTNVKSRMGGTNVWLAYKAAASRAADGSDQISHYVEGVGTHGHPLIRKFSEISGFGLTERIGRAYLNICLDYSPENTRIYLFGFSRGAFTARCVAGLIRRMGLLKKEDLILMSSKRRKRLVRDMVKAYRSEEVVPNNATPVARMLFRGLNMRGITALIDADIEMVGVWDTVDAVGVPYDWMRIALDRPYRWLTKRRLWGFHDAKLPKGVHFGAHALALDEERRAFMHSPWEPDRRVNETWFAGSHADVGGGYPDEQGLSRIPLMWMVDLAEKRGFAFREDKKSEYRLDGNHRGVAHDSRKGLINSLISYRTRRPTPTHASNGIDAMDWSTSVAVHKSVVDRMTDGTDFYAPKSIMPSDSVVDIKDSKGELTKTSKRLWSALQDVDIGEDIRKAREGVQGAAFGAWTFAFIAYLMYSVLGETETPVPDWMAWIVNMLPVPLDKAAELVAAHPLVVMPVVSLILLLEFLKRKVKSAERYVRFWIWHLSTGSEKVRAQNEHFDGRLSFIRKVWRTLPSSAVSKAIGAAFAAAFFFGAKAMLFSLILVVASLLVDHYIVRNPKRGEKSP